MACATPLERSTPPREVRTTVTVLFCDVSGSTALGERLDPESLRDVRSRYFDALRATRAVADMREGLRVLDEELERDRPGRRCRPGVARHPSR